MTAALISLGSFLGFMLAVVLICWGCLRCAAEAEARADVDLCRAIARDLDAAGFFNDDLMAVADAVAEWTPADDAALAAYLRSTP